MEAPLSGWPDRAGCPHGGFVDGGWEVFCGKGQQPNKQPTDHCNYLSILRVKFYWLFNWIIIIIRDQWSHGTDKADTQRSCVRCPEPGHRPRPHSSPHKGWCCLLHQSIDPHLVGTTSLSSEHRKSSALWLSYFYRRFGILLMGLLKLLGCC